MEALSSSELESNRQLVLLVSHQQSSADCVSESEKLLEKWELEPTNIGGA